MNKIQLIYKKLYKSFGKQGWWPLTIEGYESKHHAGEPKTGKHRFEIIIGAILTQNTNWKNVEKALYNLSKNNLIDIDKIRKMEKEKLAKLIKPAGYYNQKAERLRIIAEFLSKNKEPTRKQLLNVKGIGPETTDSILLYAYDKAFFVIDAYTKRIFERLGYRAKDYDGWQKLFMNNLPKDTELFKEYHALLVELGKNYCKKKAICEECPVKEICKKS